MNFMISILGWFLWTWVNFTIEKWEADDDGDDKTVFSFTHYKDKYWPTWIGSLACVPLLLWIGSRQLNLDAFGSLIAPGVSLGWNDLYLLAAGAAFEALIFAVKRIRKFFKNLSSKL